MRFRRMQMLSDTLFIVPFGYFIRNTKMAHTIFVSTKSLKIIIQMVDLPTIHCKNNEYCINSECWPHDISWEYHKI